MQKIPVCPFFAGIDGLTSIFFKQANYMSFLLFKYKGVAQLITGKLGENRRNPLIRRTTNTSQRPLWRKHRPSKKKRHGRGCKPASSSSLFTEQATPTHAKRLPTRSTQQRSRSTTRKTMTTSQMRQRQCSSHSDGKLRKITERIIPLPRSSPPKPHLHNNKQLRQS